MKKILSTLLFLCGISVPLFAQDTITIYYDKNWVELSSRNDAVFYRKAFENSENIWIVQDYYISNKIQMTGAYKSKKFTKKYGHFTYFYENGNKSSEGDYVNDKEEGLWNYWYDNGQKKSSGECKADKVEGVWKYWYESGEKKSEGKYMNGEQVDIWNHWFINGQLEYTETYQKSGLCTYEGYYENGVKKVYGNSEKGKLQGIWVYWNSDGRIIMKGCYNHGLKDGEWIRTFRDGEMKKLFKNGVTKVKESGGIVRKD